MFSRIVRRRALLAPRNPTCTSSRLIIQRRTLVEAPKKGDPRLMERRADRELPSIESVTFRWRHTLPYFIVLMGISSIAIFNYQKYSSPVVASVMYAARTNTKAREYLGDEIYFRHRIPWISGEMNQLHGRINISFRVKGSRNEGVMRFASVRPTARGLFETTEWSLETKDGRKIDLLDGDDPFKPLEMPMDDEEKQAAAATRGFRQNLK